MNKILLFASMLILVLAMNVASDPTLTSIGSKTVDEGTQLTFSIITTVADNGTNVFMLDGQTPVSGVSSVDIGGNTATLTRSSDTAASFVWTAPLVTTDANYNVEFSVTDGNSTDNETVQITVMNAGSNLELSDLNIGSDDQDRSNPEADDNDDEEIYDDSSTFTITNNGGSTISNVEVTWPSASKYNITYVSSSKTGSEVENGVRFASINSGETISVVVSVRIPEDFDSFDPDLSNPQDDRAFKIGDLSLTASGQNSQVSNIYLEAKNMLELKNLEICVDGDCKDYDDGDDVKNIEPGAKIEITMDAKNLFKDRANLEIQDVQFNFFADDGDLDEDHDEDIGDIKPGDTESSKMTFTLDDNIDEDDYKVEIRLEGEDENGAVHGEYWELEFQVEREAEKIVIRSAELDDETISLCSGANKQTKLEVRVENQGSDDSDEIVLVAKNDILGFYYRALQIDLDTDDDATKTATITVPSNTKPGTYQIQIYTYFDFDNYDDEDISEYKSIDLKVEECPTQTPTELEEEQKITENQSGDEEEVVVVTQPEVQEPVQPSNGAVAVPVQSVSNEKKGDSYFALIVLAYIVVIIIAIFLIGKLMRSK